MKRKAAKAAAAVLAALGAFWLSVSAIDAPGLAGTLYGSPIVSTASSASAGYDQDHQDSCADLSNAPYDLSDQDSMSRLQGAMNASIASLPQRDRLSMDVLAAEEYLVSADTDLLSVLDGTGGYAATYHDDVTGFSSAMTQVETDCQGYQVTFQADVSSAIL